MVNERVIFFNFILFISNFVSPKWQIATTNCVHTREFCVCVRCTLYVSLYLFVDGIGHRQCIANHT